MPQDQEGVGGEAGQGEAGGQGGAGGHPRRREEDGAGGPALRIQGRNSIALLKSQQTFQQKFYCSVGHPVVLENSTEKSAEISTKLLN